MAIAFNVAGKGSALFLLPNQFTLTPLMLFDEVQDGHRGSQAGVKPKASASANANAPATCRHGAPLKASVLVGVPVILDMPGGNINASIIMIAWRATDLIDRRKPLDSIHF